MRGANNRGHGKVGGPWPHAEAHPKGITDIQLHPVLLMGNVGTILLELLIF
jgi:hypothetical protein